MVWEPHLLLPYGRRLASGAQNAHGFAMQAASPERTATQLTAGLLAARTPALTEATTCGEVFDWFTAHPAVPAAAILDSTTGAVLGLVNRFIFFARYARQYVPELFARKTILKLANRAPLIVAADSFLVV